MFLRRLLQLFLLVIRIEVAQATGSGLLELPPVRDVFVGHIGIVPVDEEMDRSVV